MKKILLVVLVFILLGCDSPSSSSDVAKQRIYDKLTNLSEAFAINDIGGIMSIYSNDFHHDGYGLITAENNWAAKLVENNFVEIENLKITKHNEYAEASFNLIYTDTDGNEEIEAVPDDNDELKYFYYENGEWLIYGNQK